MVLGFGINKAWVILLLIIPSITYIPMSFVSASLYNKMRTHHVVYLAALLQIIGCWIRSFAFTFGMFWPILFGTLIYMLSVPMLLSAISLIANLWFSDDQRGTATSLMGIAMPCGSMVGLTVTGLLCVGMDNNDPNDCLRRI